MNDNIGDNKGDNKPGTKLNILSDSDMEFSELSYYGLIVEIKGKDFLKLDKEKFKLIRLGTKEETVKTEKGDALYIAKRWGVIVPKGTEKEFVNTVKDKWVLPDVLADFL